MIVAAGDPGHGRRAGTRAGARAGDGDPDLPAWARRIAQVLPEVRWEELSRFAPPPEEADRAAAVLMLFARSPRPVTGLTGGSVLLIERAETMRSHPGQVAFPGGGVDPGDASVAAAALREAQEETLLDPAGVHVLGTLPELYLPPSRYAVTPVVAWWHRRSPVGVGEPAEVARVVEVELDELLDPANRFTVAHPSGFVGPGFRAGGLFVWGFTAGLLSRLLARAGLEQPWDDGRREPLP